LLTLQYIRTFSGWVYAAFVIDVFARLVVGWQLSTSLHTDRLADADAVASVGPKGDSDDNALAEAFDSLFKAELIRNKGPWRGINYLEIATAEYIDWFNHRRLHNEIGYRPPIEVEKESLNRTTPAITAMERV
jgi:putative transposase